MNLFLDFETRSEEDIKKTGLRRYLTKAQPVLLAWSFTEDLTVPAPVFQWDWFHDDGNSPLDYNPMLLDALTDPEVRKSAFNAPFEVQVFRQCLEHQPNLNQWQCTMAHAYSRGFAGTLDQVCQALHIDQDQAKLKTGGRLITKFCKPRKSSKSNPDQFFEPRTAADQWEQFREYNRQDVVAEMAVARELAAFPWSAEERALWIWDRQINDRGMPIDMPFVSRAIEMVGRKHRELDQTIRNLTGGIGGNQNVALLEWARALGYPHDNLRADTVRSFLEGA